MINPSLMSLFMFTFLGVLALAAAVVPSDQTDSTLSGSSLKSLLLRDNFITRACSAELYDRLVQNHTLISIELRGNQV